MSRYSRSHRVRNQAPTSPTIDGASPRRHLLAATLPFVQAASRLPGVTRVALLGSLTTEKADPKDIDLLVTIADETDVSELDRLARQLQGRISGTARGLYGVDVFLADSTGRYLGGLCKHRECPSLRQCAGRHCGLRPVIDSTTDMKHAHSAGAGSRLIGEKQTRRAGCPASSWFRYTQGKDHTQRRIDYVHRREQGACPPLHPGGL